MLYSVAETVLSRLQSEGGHFAAGRRHGEPEAGMGSGAAHRGQDEANLKGI